MDSFFLQMNDTAWPHLKRLIIAWRLPRGQKRLPPPPLPTPLPAPQLCSGSRRSQISSRSALSTRQSWERQDWVLFKWCPVTTVLLYYLAKDLQEIEWFIGTVHHIHCYIERQGSNAVSLTMILEHCGGSLCNILQTSGYRDRSIE